MIYTKNNFPAIASRPKLVVGLGDPYRFGFFKRAACFGVFCHSGIVVQGPIDLWSGGVHIFRPDLSISPVVYSDFYIDKVTYEFNKKSYRKAIAISAVIIALIFGAIMWYTWSR